MARIHIELAAVVAFLYEQIAARQAGGGAEQVGDGAAAGGEQGGEEQDDKALVGGMVEDRGERGEDGPGELGYNQHGDHLVEEPWGV